MKRSEIIPALEALTASWKAQYGTGVVSFAWSLSNDPEPWVKLNGQYLFRACKFDDVPLEEARNRELWESEPGFAFLDYEEQVLYVGPVDIYISSYNGAKSLTAIFKIPNPANPEDADFSRQLGQEPVPMREECLDCCKYGRRRCAGRPITAFPDLPEGEKPKCYEECPDECPYEGECPSLHNYPPDEFLDGLLDSEN